MSLGPEKIILILVVALIVFGPQRLPEIARQVGAAVRELRRMQDTVRGELDQVLHPDYSPPSSPNAATGEIASIDDTDHAALPPGSVPAETAPEEDVTDDGFSGPRSFS
ncbi:MAG: Sec-independent protein translocase subunit TatA/TatB [Acidimicrobiia bacterium]